MPLKLTFSFMSSRDAKNEEKFSNPECFWYGYKIRDLLSSKSAGKWALHFYQSKTLPNFKGASLGISKVGAPESIN